MSTLFAYRLSPMWSGVFHAFMPICQVISGIPTLATASVSEVSQAFEEDTLAILKVIAKRKL